VVMAKLDITPMRSGQGCRLVQINDDATETHVAYIKPIRAPKDEQ
jgi:hypothetical protein